MSWGPEQWDELTLGTSAEEGTAVAPETEFLRTLLDKLPGRRRMTVADLGCGAGDWLPFLARRFKAIVAVDFAPATLARARRNHPSPNVTFRRRDVRDLTPFRRRFNVALLIGTFVGSSIEDVDRILSEVQASLVEGGLLAASFPARPRKGRPVPMRLAGDGIEATPLQFTEVDVQYRLRRAGFLGLRLERFQGNGERPEVILAIAARRASN